MKKIFLSLSLIMTVATASFANDARDPDPEVKEVFKKEFPGAQSVVWSEQDGFYKATFILANHRTIAYFDRYYELVGCVRDIFYDQLPITVMKAIDKKFPTASFSEVREITNDDGTSYLLKIEEGSKKYKVKVTSEGSFTEITKVNK
ncbi:MAG: hypothetical protein HOP10_14800 [Chitinophagaceae bacterium]|nr:hypothetical protein [Chitinophagaceae bacterium]